MRSIGAMAMDEQFFFVNLPELYDVLVYIEDTSASVMLGSGPGNNSSTLRNE
jgi:hypothetical protein